eukprot:scaffold628_cov357-Pavlova_lutheri.AAC.2
MSDRKPSPTYRANSLDLHRKDEQGAKDGRVVDPPGDSMPDLYRGRPPEDLSPEGHSTSPRGHVPQRTLNAPQRTLDVPQRTHDVPQRIVNVPLRTPCPPEDTQCPQRTRDVPQRTCPQRTCPQRTLNVPLRRVNVPQRTHDVPQRTLHVPQRDILTWSRGTCGGFAKGSIARAKCIHVATNFLQTTIPFHCTTSGRYVFISFGNSRPMTSK